jgi:hypothetical protein
MDTCNLERNYRGWEAADGIWREWYALGVFGMCLDLDIVLVIGGNWNAQECKESFVGTTVLG